MKTDRNHHRSLAALAAAGLLSFGAGAAPLIAQEPDDLPPPPPPAGAAGPRGERPPPPPDGRPGPEGRRGPGREGRGPRGGRPAPPPRPEEDDLAARQPVDPEAAPAAVQAATAAAAGFAPGQVWSRTAPRGEQQLEATILFQNKEVVRLEFDPATGEVRPRGLRPPPPPGGPAAPARRDADRGANPPRPVPGGSDDVPPPLDAKDGGRPPREPAPPAVAAPGNPAGRLAAPATVAPEQIRARLPEIIKGLSVGQGAEVAGHEGFWRVPVIYRHRVVGELRVSGDGQRVIQDFAAAREAAIFARN